MEEIEEEKLMKEIAEMLEEEVKRIEEATCEDEQIKSIESIELLKTIWPPLNTAPPQRPSTSTSSSTSRRSSPPPSRKGCIGKMKRLISNFELHSHEGKPEEKYIGQNGLTFIQIHIPITALKPNETSERMD